MSRNTASFVLGYHGCDRDVGLKALVEGVALTPSDKDYDWLGPGVYFWEADPRRAFEWSEEKMSRGDYTQPFVIGAVIDLGNCLDLLQRDNIAILTDAYANLKQVSRKAGTKLPRNKDLRNRGGGDKVLRYLDCAVIRHLHGAIQNHNETHPAADHFEPFDTVRGFFVEGEAAYKGGGFFAKSHTQIAVRTPACIKGLFKPPAF